MALGEIDESYVINIVGRYLIHITKEIEENTMPQTRRVYLIDNYGSSYCISWGDHNGLISNRKTSFEYYRNKPFTEYLYGTGGDIPLAPEAINYIKLKEYPTNNQDLVKELLKINK